MIAGHQRLLSVLALSLFVSACGGDGSPASPDSPDAGQPKATAAVIEAPAKLAIVADWLHRSLSYVDLDKLAAGGATRASIVTATVDLGAYAPGPLVVKLTPDRKKALVSVSAGFFSIPFAGVLVNATDIPTGPGSVLFVDVATGKVEGELATGDSPMGIAFTPDGTRAYVTHFTSGDLAVVDVAKRTVIERFPLGVYPEEIAFDDTSTVGVLGYSAEGSVAVFSVADIKNTLKDVPFGGDSAGVAFFPGTKVAFIVQAPNPLVTTSGFSVIDVSNPAAPRVLQDERLPEAPIAYPAIPAKSRGSVLVPTTVAGRLTLREYKLEGEQAKVSSTIDIADASLLAGLGVSFDEDHTVLIAWPAQRALVAVDLTAKTSRVIPWLEGVAGPADVIIR